MNNRTTLHKIIFLFLFFLFMRFVVYGTSYMGRDNSQTTYYVCKDNKEVAELLGYNADDFDLSDYNMVAKKCDVIRTGDDVNIYVVMININDTFIVCYRAAEYDIFFYSWDFED